MITHDSDCVSCHAELGCAIACPRRFYPVLRCDDCGRDTDELFRVNNEDGELCAACAKKLVIQLYEQSPEDAGLLGDALGVPVEKISW